MTTPEPDRPPRLPAATSFVTDPEVLARARVIRAREARAARGILESALDAAGWRWSPRLSLWLDALLRIEEEAGP